jgi:prevent-host-death family protein
MNTVTIHAAKTNLSKLLVRVEAGEEIVLARGDRPIAKIVPYAPPAPELAPQKPKRQFGSMRGHISLGPEFFDPLPNEELALWEGGGD